MARSSMPSSVQHGSTSARARSSLPCSPASRRRAARGRAGRRTRTSGASPSSAARWPGCGARRGGRPPSAGRCRRSPRPGAWSATTTSPSTSRSLGREQALGDGVRDGPAAGAAAQGGGRLQLVGAARGIEVPRAELGERPAATRSWRCAGSASARWTSSSPPAASNARDAWRPYSLGLVAQLGDHDAASRTRASRIRCISMLPEAMVADTE